MRRSTWLLLVVPLICPALAAQTVQNATLRRAQQAFDNLDYRQALSLGHASLRERLTGFERARAYEMLGFTYSGMDSILKAVDAFKQVVLIEPERELDPNRTSPKALSAFQVALTQILVIRQLRVDSVEFIGGQLQRRRRCHGWPEQLLRVAADSGHTRRGRHAGASDQPARLHLPARDRSAAQELAAARPGVCLHGRGAGGDVGVVERQAWVGVDAGGRRDWRRDPACGVHHDAEEARPAGGARQHSLQLAAA